MAWPTHADGTNKRVGDMTPDERETVLAEARARMAAKLHSYYGAEYVIRAATIIEQRPSGHHVERWQTRVEVEPDRKGFLHWIGGTDPFWFATEAEAVAAFDRAV